jgi:ketosteroid isomerase-like protein
MTQRLVLAVIVIATATAAVLGYAVDDAQSDAIVAVERAALEQWGKGDPDGFLGTYAEEVTYFDPAQERRVDGRSAMVSLLAPLRGKFRVHRFEMLNPRVQRHGEIAVLTYNLVNYEKQPDGTERPTTRWNSTAVFRRIGGQWRTIHSHWSYTKPDLK